MSVSAAHMSTFFTEVRTHDEVFTIRDSGGIPAPLSPSGERAMPFWSRKSRARRVIDQVPACEGFEPVRVPLADFRAKWLPGLRADGRLVGMNWSGERATGYDLTPDEVRTRLDTQLS